MPAASTSSITARQELQMEFSALSNPSHCPTGIYVLPDASDVFRWHGVLFIHRGYYASSTLRFTITIPPNYPALPTVTFSPAVFHPLVDPSSGRVNLRKRFPEWRARVDFLFMVLGFLKSMFKRQCLDSLRPEDCFNKEALNLYRNQTPLFTKLASQSALLSITDSSLYGPTTSTPSTPSTPTNKTSFCGGAKTAGSGSSSGSGIKFTKLSEEETEELRKKVEKEARGRIVGRELGVINSLEVTEDASAHKLDPTKPTIVFIHGITSALEFFSGQFGDERLTSRYNLVAFDLYVHGRTTGADRDQVIIEELAKQASLAIEKLQLESFYLVAENYLGCNVSVWLTIWKPSCVKALVIASPGFPRENPEVAQEMTNEWVEEATVNKNGKGDGTGALPVEILTSFDMYFLCGTRRPGYEVYRDAWLQFQEQRLGKGHSDHDLSRQVRCLLHDQIPPDLVGRITAPVLLLQGGGDTLYASPPAAREQWERLLTSVEGGVEVQTIPGAPHMLLWTDSAAANGAIVDFLAKVEGDSTH
ncbi:hypothetical protein MNV49_006574 [Pseudohyphozyma bogoriensis]|nr:hypothetical protein MNV49_006574 [Pseudohyphozyma bogoriensis]